MKRENRYVLTVIMVIVLTAANCMGDLYIPVAGFGMHCSLPASIAITALGAGAFLVSPRLARMDILCKQLRVLLLPILFPLAWSLIAWITSGAGGSEIRRGVIGIFYLFFSICAVASLVYVAGESAGWYYLLSLITANLVTMLSVILEGGAAAFFAEFWELLISFADQTGPLMKQMEIQGITYALGIYLTSFMVDRAFAKKAWPLAAATVFCFLTGLKRIGVAAVVAAGAVGIVFLLLKRFQNMERLFLRVAGVIFIGAALAYVSAIYFGLFDYMEQVGMDTNMRAHIYSIYKPYYKISPAFLGNGTGWVDDIFQHWQMLADETTIFEVYHTHNDFLRIYIELGMAGFLLWCHFRCNYQISRAFRFLGTEGGIMCLALVIYMGITYMTDSTSTQIYINSAFAAVMMSYRLKEREEKRESEMKLENRRLSDPFVGSRYE